MVFKEKVISNCRILLQAYENGKLGQTRMPEDSNPGFTDNQAEERLAYFTLPMALNYQRNSYKLWEAALKTYTDKETKSVFEVSRVCEMPVDELKKKLLKYKLALQPSRHTEIWQKISKTIFENWRSFKDFFKTSENDFLKIKDIIQGQFKKDFPYLSGPKIFNYWSFIISTYGQVPLLNREFIEIAPDTHITKCSVLLGVISEKEARKLSKDQISKRWREILGNSGIAPIDMHPPLWFWSRNGFIFKLKEPAGDGPP
ncbi:MAG: hypothetical protein PHW31_02955 [Candidatus Pacebacteria bacterium]|nr:hypothetical protein [Candidatus Paceibacterota bacterium]